MTGKACCTPARRDAAQARELAEPHARSAGQAREFSAEAESGHAGLDGDQAPSLEFISLPGGAFVMGSNDPDGLPADGEGPAREVTVSPFRIAPITVTNAQFANFVRATGYVTQAEEAGSSFVFYLQVPAGVRSRIRQYPSGLPWWLEVPDACWQRPAGPGSSIRDRQDHPVVHVSWDDAQAYCQWAGVRLPTEAQWEFAARGGLARQRYPWGNDLPEPPPCNIWRGTFPHQPAERWTPETVPVRSFKPNAFGLYCMAGNVWEWCEDWFSPHYHGTTESHDPVQRMPTGRRSARGGSFLCHDSYCNRYRVAARGSNTPDSSSSNQGFRVVSS